MRILKGAILAAITALVLILAMMLYALDRLVWRVTGWSFIDWLYERVDHRVDKVQRNFSAGPGR